MNDLKLIKSIKYETVAASQTAQALGATGAAGDILEQIVIVPSTVNPGKVDIIDNATAINVFVGGAGAITDLKPITVPFGFKSVSGAWKITTGANVTVVASGIFS